jgi:hypothetical protein
MGFKIKWTPDLEQDLDAITTRGTIVYDEQLTDRLIEEHGNIDKFKKSEKFKQMKQEFENIKL